MNTYFTAFLFTCNNHCKSLYFFIFSIDLIWSQMIFYQSCYEIAFNPWALRAFVSTQRPAPVLQNPYCLALYTNISNSAKSRSIIIHIFTTVLLYFLPLSTVVCVPLCLPASTTYPSQSLQPCILDSHLFFETKRALSSSYLCLYPHLYQHI